jgi:ATP phosphoribosyltransferase regulatory subunit
VARRRRVEAALRATLDAAGYLEISMPLLQPADPAADWGTAYRVLDQDGALLELRRDMTLPLARLCAAGDPDGPRPRRLYYAAPLFRRGADGPRELLQVGAERIGGAEAAWEADAEVLTLCVRCLRAAGLARFLLAVGDVGYLRELLAAAPGAPALFAALQRRDLAAVAAAGALGRSLLWTGSVEDALSGGLSADGPEGRRFLRLLAALEAAGLADQVVVEPALVLPAGYYSGLVFEALLPDVPGPVGDGGRYDGLLGRWGRAEPAVGFALDCDRLLAALPPAAGAEDAAPRTDPRGEGGR